MQRNSSIMLVIPPAFYPHMPYLGTATLVAALRQRRISCSQIDLSVHLYEHLLQLPVVRKAWHGLQAVKRQSSLAADYARRLELTSHPLMESVATLVPEAKLAVRGHKNKLPKTVDPWRVLTLGLDIVSDTHYPESLSFTGYKGRLQPTSSRAVFDEVVHKADSIYYNNSYPVLREQIVTEKPKVVGFSITAADQIIPAAGLSDGIRKEFPDMRILWGGSIVTRLSDVFTKANPLSSLYDALVFGEGDNIISEAVFALSSTSRHDVRIFQVKPENACIDNLDAPCFDGLPLDLYFDSHLTLPLLASRRCYWGKCLFCDIPTSYAPYHRSLSPSKVVDDMEVLVKNYGTRYIKFVDDSLSPNLMKSIALEILRRGLEVEWEAYVRLEDQFADTEFCNLIRKAGCRWLYFGLETGSENTLLKMGKGNRKAKSSEILRTVANAGIKVHIWVIIGFPTETRDDIKRTTEFVVRHHDYLHSIEVNQFALSRHAPVMSGDALSTFGISPKYDADNDLTLVYDYNVSVGLSQEEAKSLTFEVREIFRRELAVPDVVRSSHLGDESVPKKNNATASMA